MSKTKVQRSQYGQDSLIKAVSAVRNGKCTVYKASKLYNIPKETLRRHAKGKVADFNRPGRDRLLTDEEERAVVEFISYNARHNFPLKRQDLRSVILGLVKRRKTGTSHRNFRFDIGPSDKWFRSFKKRHPNLRWNVPQTIDARRVAQSDEYIVMKYFNLLENVLKENDLFDKPHCIYNCDESGMKSQVQTHEKCYSIRGEACYQEKVASIDHITSMSCVRADGKMLPTFLIYSKRMPAFSTYANLPKDWLYGTSPNGYMDKELFKEWFLNLFIKHCGKERPILLVMDNHDSHFSLEVLEKAIEERIILVGLPAHTTHILQPLDVGVFMHIKRKFNSLCIATGARSARARITKQHFPTAWKLACNAATSAVIQSAFKRSGIYPFDPTAIDDSKMRKREVVTATTYQRAEVIQPVSTANLGDSDTVTEGINSGHIDTPCEKCGLYPHPVAAVRDLPPELQAEFPILDRYSTPQDPPKRQHITLEARIITSEEIVKQMKEKEARQKTCSSS